MTVLKNTRFIVTTEMACVHWGLWMTTIPSEVLFHCSTRYVVSVWPLFNFNVIVCQVLDEYQKNFGDSWKTCQADNAQPWPYLNEALAKFQDPAEADKLLKIQRELDETKIILHKTIESVLERGEKLDSLVEKSSDLSAASQVVRLMKKKGTNTVLVDSAGAGDIVSMAGLANPAIGHTIASVQVMTALPTVELDPPTISMTFGVNDSPLAGRDGIYEPLGVGCHKYEDIKCLFYGPSFGWGGCKSSRSHVIHGSCDDDVSKSPSQSSLKIYFQ